MFFTEWGRRDQLWFSLLSLSKRSYGMVLQSIICLFVFYFKKIENVFCLHITWYKHNRVLGEFETVMQNSDLVEGTQNCSRYCPNPSSVYITPCKHRKMFSIPCYKITFPRKRRKTLCLWQMKGKWLVVIYIIVQKILPVLVWQKRGFYFHLKCRLMPKNFHTACLYRFFKYQTSKLWLNRVTCWVFSSKLRSKLWFPNQCLHSKTCWCYNCVYINSCKHTCRVIRA